MDRKINILIEYLYAFKDTVTKAEVRKILKRLKNCGVKSIVCGEKEYRLTNNFINRACIARGKV